VEQSKGILSNIEKKDTTETKEEEEASKYHHEEVVALDKNYEEKSHKFAKKFLQDHPKK